LEAFIEELSSNWSVVVEIKEFAVFRCYVFAGFRNEVLTAF